MSRRQRSLSPARTPRPLPRSFFPHRRRRRIEFRPSLIEFPDRFGIRNGGSDEEEEEEEDASPLSSLLSLVITRAKRHSGSGAAAVPPHPFTQHSRDVVARPVAAPSRLVA